MVLPVGFPLKIATGDLGKLPVRNRLHQLHEYSSPTVSPRWPYKFLQPKRVATTWSFKNPGILPIV